MFVPIAAPHRPSGYRGAAMPSHLPVRSGAVPRALAVAAIALMGGACQPTSDTALEVEVEDLSAENLLSTSVEVRWESQEPTLARLRYGIEGIHENKVFSGDEPALDHQVQVHFLRPDTEYLFRVELIEDGAIVGSEDGSFVTAPVPDELPELDVTVDALDEHGLILATVMGDHMAPVVISQEGYYAWWHIEEAPNVTVSQARMAPDGRSIYYAAYDRGESEEPDSEYWIRRVHLDDGHVDSLQTRRQHHDFWVHDDGTIAWLRGEVYNLGGQNHRGDSVVETDPDGNETEIWSAHDQVDVHLDRRCEPTTTVMWTHANALYYDAPSDTYLVSLRDHDTVVAFDRATTETRWKLGGCESDFEFGPAREFDGQHQIDLLGGDRLLVYDNQLTSGRPSRAVELKLDFDRGLATKVWSYRAGGAYHTDVLGDVQRLSSGDTLVTWSTAGTLEQVTPQGELVWQAEFGFGTALGYNTLLD
jgi:hypothetical protein